MAMSRLGYCKYLQSGEYTKDQEFLDLLCQELLHMLSGLYHDLALVHADDVISPLEVLSCNWA